MEVKLTSSIVFLLSASICITSTQSTAADTKIEMKIIHQKEECIHALNVIRQNHNVPNLNWNTELAYQAEEWALTSALRQQMAVEPSSGVGENVYRSFGTSKDTPPVPCSRAIFSWYNGIKHFDYDDPKWTYQNGVFIQIAYDAAYTFGIGVVHYHGNTFVVGKFSKVMSPYDSELKSKIKKPKKELTLKDIQSNTVPKPIVQTVQVPANGGYTSFFKTGTCSVECGQGTIEARRYCVRQKTQQPSFCSQSRTTRMECKGEGSNCPSTTCADKHTDCEGYANRGDCNDSRYQPWLKVNCPLSCRYCPCKDIHKDCAGYADDKKYCDTGPYQQWMKVNCKSSCRLCQPGCANIHKDCDRYANDADKQYCKKESKYYDWMKVNCQKACSFCT